ncbi:hypothetical protein ENSA5_12580 [Enhygromyxa salina]|uniref:Uncharacterized protein n=1 Tax=Enhygromyxa salina TaxID=215803 RepID=A0A2S9YFL5_9BACT|nr:hypothetical protein ENSA5_12580 [Enhygromyxa salina]
MSTPESSPLMRLIFSGMACCTASTLRWRLSLVAIDAPMNATHSVRMSPSGWAHASPAGKRPHWKLYSPARLSSMHSYCSTLPVPNSNTVRPQATRIVTAV